MVDADFHPLASADEQLSNVLVVHGWLRVLGGGPPPMNLALANDLEMPVRQPPGWLLVAWAMTERFAQFYEQLRWPGWEEGVEVLKVDQEQHRP